jgi:hypothetical protein
VNIREWFRKVWLRLFPPELPIDSIMEINVKLDKNKNLHIKMDGDSVTLLKMLFYLEKLVQENQKGMLKVPIRGVKTKGINIFKTIGESEKGIFAKLRLFENQREKL